MDHPRPELKYVDAKDLDSSGMKFDGTEVDGIDGEKLGDVEGFVIDVATGRPRHVAVSAGWLFHKHFLLPIGHVQLRADRSKLIADVTKERVDRFPGFDKSEFEQLSADQLKQLDETLARACSSGDEVTIDFESHYATPEWWEVTSYKGPVAQSRM
jgi:hypothetical protein